jgi:hypothetical protein
VLARRSRKRGSLDGSRALLGVLLLFIAIAAALALAYFYVVTPRKPKLDTASLCPTTGPVGITVVLVDTSDDLPETTKREVAVILDDLVSSLPDYYKLDVRVIDIAGLRSRSLFSKCNPGDGAGLSEWTDNPRIARLRWIESFKKPASDAIKNSLASAKASSSPIMAAIQDIAIDQFSSAQNSSIRKRLVIISDMLEHTPLYTQYRSSGDLSYKRYRETPAYLKFRTDLHGAAVEIDYVNRNVAIDTVRHVDFWREWISDNGGVFEKARRLQGK